MAMTEATLLTTRTDVRTLFTRKRRIAFAVPAVILAYFVYIFFAFDIAGLAAKARMDNAAILLSDFWSYKTHVTRDNRSGEIEIAIEGETRGTYPEGRRPEWVRDEGAETVISLRGGHTVVFEPAANGGGAFYDVPDYGRIDIRPGNGKLDLTLPGPLPGDIAISQSDNRIAVTTSEGRFNYTRSKVEVFRYQPGWELFFFTLDSPFSGKSLPELAALALWGDRVDSGRSNAGYMLTEFLTNKMWHHDQVIGAVIETLLMAFLGTFGAAIIIFPVAFLAASNFTPLKSVRFALRRVFDFVRGVDALIWTIILSRAFGPGPMTGALAILITDLGSFGKLFSEALENIDDKQVEGVRSTGATGLQRARFGVIPQVTPVILSQVLYFLESNTRGATVIGAIVGGGIGLLLTQAIITQKDWEEVSYYMVLIVLMVILMDNLSGWLRRKLIKGDGGGH